MTWSPFLTDVTAGPTSTTAPAPSWPRIAGNRPSGSAPERVNSSVWQTPVALISPITSPALGPPSSTVSMGGGAPALCATAARTSMWLPPGSRIREDGSRPGDGSLGARADFRLGGRVGRGRGRDAGARQQLGDRAAQAGRVHGLEQHAVCATGRELLDRARVGLRRQEQNRHRVLEAQHRGGVNAV